MKVKDIPFRDLPKDKEGLVIHGAGGNLQDWILGIARELNKNECAPTRRPESLFSEVLRPNDNVNGSEGRIDLVLVFNPAMQFNIGRMAAWRLDFQDCSWLSDFITNYRSDYR